MATPSTSTTNNNNNDASLQPTEFELRRSALVGQIGNSLEQVLTQINALNRSLEGIIEIGNEFASVEALWSQFETVMGTSASQPQPQPQPSNSHLNSDANVNKTEGDGGANSDHGAEGKRDDDDDSY